ncbi:LysR substrate-binding domain-containing protein [Nocardia abscessus]|uniref:LysR substrate-binding domain-containing protein n=1 Tax=Nocardia abscessus TaxID=120957 RepID=UPI0024572142|nr:LysR substrate-binding domain-containing protein [Nocardia abscessus]
MSVAQPVDVDPAVVDFAVAALLVSSSRYVGLVPQRLADQYGRTLGIRWFPIPAALPELEVRLLWHARLDADPAQRWLRETIRNTLCAPSVDSPGGSERSAE